MHFAKPAKAAPPRRVVALVLALVMALLLAGCAGAQDDADKDPPNVVFIITDDESWFERGIYGVSEFPSPHFESVASKGVLFRNGHTSAPSCAPSRAAILTGRNFWELEQGAFIQAWLPDKFPMVTQILAEEGYAIGQTGKIYGPAVTFPDSHDTNLVEEANDVLFAEPPAPELSLFDYVATFENFMETRSPDVPFFFWVGIEEPHGPFGEENYKLLESQYGISLDDLMMPGDMEDTPENRIHRGNYAYELAYSDDQIGRVLKVLEDAGELDNTLVIITSDNGTTQPAANKAKATAYEQGTRVPLAIMFPERIAAGREVSDFVTLADMAPTILDFLDIEIPDSMSGRSFLNVLEANGSGRIDASRDYAVTGLEWHGEFDPRSLSARTIRNDRYALILNYDNVDSAGRYLDNDAMQQPSSMELYDLYADPWQLRNLIDDEELSSIKEELLAKLTDYALETGDPRFTGDLDTFRKTRQYVIARKKGGYIVDNPLDPSTVWTEEE